MSKSKKKNRKNKSYDYKKTNKPEARSDRKNSLSFSMPSIQLGLGFLVFFMSRYIHNAIQSKVVCIFGLLIMLYSMYASYKQDKERKKEAKKTNTFIDISMGILITIAVIYNLYLLVKLI